MYFQDKNLNFTHIPKTGGSYIEFYILRHIMKSIKIDANFNSVRKYINNFLVKDKVFTKNNIYHVPAKNDINSHFKNSFCVLRDPVEIKKSTYRWLVERGKYKKNFNDYIVSNDFRKFPNDNPEEKIPSFCRTQCDYIMDKNNQIIVKNIFLYERFEECLDYIDSVFGKKIKRGDRVNVCKNIPIKVSNKAKDIILNYYKDDFELLRMIEENKLNLKNNQTKYERNPSE